MKNLKNYLLVLLFIVSSASVIGVFCFAFTGQFGWAIFAGSLLIASMLTFDYISEG